jgi:hypothetical protein
MPLTLLAYIVAGFLAFALLAGLVDRGRGRAGKHRASRED